MTSIRFIVEGAVFMYVEFNCCEMIKSASRDVRRHNPVQIWEASADCKQDAQSESLSSKSGMFGSEMFSKVRAEGEHVSVTYLSAVGTRSVRQLWRPKLHGACLDPPQKSCSLGLQDQQRGPDQHC